jgi:hypothetical protein
MICIYHCRWRGAIGPIKGSPVMNMFIMYIYSYIYIYIYVYIYVYIYTYMYIYTADEEVLSASYRDLLLSLLKLSDLLEENIHETATAGCTPIKIPLSRTLSARLGYICIYIYICIYVYIYIYIYVCTYIYVYTYI